VDDREDHTRSHAQGSHEYYQRGKPGLLPFERVSRLAGPGRSNVSFTGLADSEHVPIGVAHVHLAHVPRHVRRRPSYFQSL
jgi:hypothetical protein